MAAGSAAGEPRTHRKGASPAKPGPYHIRWCATLEPRSPRSARHVNDARAARRKCARGPQSRAWSLLLGGNLFFFFFFLRVRTVPNLPTRVRVVRTPVDGNARDGEARPLGVGTCLAIHIMRGSCSGTIPRYLAMAYTSTLVGICALRHCQMVVKRTAQLAQNDSVHL